MQQQIAIRESSPPTAADSLHWLDAIESDSDKIIVSLSGRTDDELLDIRAAARSMGRAAWRIECAADAEIMNRVSARQGRLKDTEGKGVHSAVLKAAQDTGLSVSTIYDNAAIYKTFFASPSARSNNERNGSIDLLDDKEFFRAAMRTDDPHATLEEFAQAKADDPRFNTRDAWRLVKQKKAPHIDAPAAQSITDNAHIAEKWTAAKKALQELVGVAPHLTGAVKVALEEIEYEISRPSESNRALIFEALSEGYDEIDEIAKRIHKNRDYVLVWMNRLEEEGAVKHFAKEPAPTARGQRRTGWEIV